MRRPGIKRFRRGDEKCLMVFAAKADVGRPFFRAHQSGQSVFPSCQKPSRHGRRDTDFLPARSRRLIKLVPVAGLEPARRFMVPGF